MQSLTGFFGRHRRLLIGVDISDTQVRVVSLSKQAGRYRVEGYCIGELADGAVEDGVIGDVDTVALCLERLVERMGLRTHGAALAIKSGAAFTKHVMLDSTLARREIEELMLVEAESSLPYALDEVYLDYAIADGVIAGAARRPQNQVCVFLISRKRGGLRVVRPQSLKRQYYRSRLPLKLLRTGVLICISIFDKIRSRLERGRLPPLTLIR